MHYNIIILTYYYDIAYFKKAESKAGYIQYGHKYINQIKSMH